MPGYDPQRHHRRSIRLQNYDYSQPGAYFVTLVTHQRAHTFGKIQPEGSMQLSLAGEIVEKFWQKLPARYPKIALDEAVVMPNHFHGILWIKDAAVGEVGVIHELPQPPQLPLSPETTEEKRIRRRQMLLPKVIGYFKMNTAKAINQHAGNTGAPVWQRNYYEHIIRNERALKVIRRYIRANPVSWSRDRENR